MDRQETTTNNASMMYFSMKRLQLADITIILKH